jgi:hypothetical protein
MELAHLGRLPERFHVVVVIVLQDAPDDDGSELIEVQRGIQTVILCAALPKILFHLSRQGRHVDVDEVEVLFNFLNQIAVLRR